jgi:hypothetical protein
MKTEAQTQTTHTKDILTIHIGIKDKARTRGASTHARPGPGSRPGQGQDRELQGLFRGARSPRSRPGNFWSGPLSWDG